MSPEGALFGDDDTPATTDARPPAAAGGIADWPLKQLRGALDATGLDDMTARQQLIEQLAGRPVASLRDLRSSEARALLEQLNMRASTAAKRSRGSSWDERDENTWIDRL